MKIQKSTAIIYFIVVLFFNEQAQHNIFVKVYEVPQSLFTQSFELIETHDKSYLTGNVGTLLKIDSAGNKKILWQNTIISTFSIVKTHDEGYVCAGRGGLFKLDTAFNMV